MKTHSLLSSSLHDLLELSLYSFYSLSDDDELTAHHNREFSFSWGAFGLVSRLPGYRLAQYPFLM